MRCGLQYPHWKPVRLHISTVNRGDDSEAQVEYELDADWRHVRVEKGKVYG